MKLSFGVKIRFLLLILGLCLILTSISLNNYSTRAEYLEIEGKTVQRNLNDLETQVNNFINNPEELKNLKKFETEPNLALDFIKNYRPKGINLFIYQNSSLKFWSTFKVDNIVPSKIKEGKSVLFFNNGWYETIKKTDGDFIFIFLIDIQNKYQIEENEFFKNNINPLLTTSGNLTISNFTDKDIFIIKSLENKYLFGLKFKPEIDYTYLKNTQFWLFLAGVVCICIFFNSLCSYISKKGNVKLATALLFTFFLLLRLTDLYFGWFNKRFDIDFFNSSIYYKNFWLPSLGDFFFNTVAITWVLLFAYRHRSKYRLPYFLSNNKISSLIIQFILFAFIGGFAIVNDNLFLDIILSTKINFDIVNILKLGGASWVAIVLLCLVWFQIFLITALSVSISKQLNLSTKERFYVFIFGFTLFFIFKLIVGFTLFFVIYAILIFVLYLNLYIPKNTFSIGTLVLIFSCLAFNTSIKYIKYRDIKERNQREGLALSFENPNDFKTIESIEKLEKRLFNDRDLISYHLNPNENRFLTVKNHIKDYLDGYLSRYNYKIFSYDRFNLPITSNSGPISKYKKMVENGAFKISSTNFFYRLNNTFGYQEYFGIIPVLKEQEIIGTLVIELSTRTFKYDNKLKDILTGANSNTADEMKGYSAAIYKDNNLVNQTGDFTFPLNCIKFKPELKKFKVLSEDNISHLVYKPSPNKTIIISKEKVDYLERLAALSFFFIVFIIFSILLFALVWINKNLEDERIGWFNINRILMINANKILYKTRIQFSIVLSVVATLIIVGWISYYFMEKGYIIQQNVEIQEKIKKIQANYEKDIFDYDQIYTDESDIADFNDFADINNTDLNLYDANGTLMMSTYPKLFSNQIIGKKMPPSAYIMLKKFNKTDYINNKEKIGLLTYTSAYAPIKNSENKTLGYITLPNYSNEEDYKDKIGLFLSNLINIYALIFVSVGVLAFILSNQITSPLTFIQENISKAKLGVRGEPIKWKRHDEIGSLIKEYNAMIDALDESAIKLVKSERESAWREMAKQVAHEIKNPLTPLKLGVQLLEKSWKEEDPNFEIKFKKFSKSFIEQIESLSKIATEFSDFAKMPDTRLEKFDITPIIEKIYQVFHSDDVEININNNSYDQLTIEADKDQILRTFNNLFKNAIEANRDADKCIIAVDIFNDNEFVYIEIQDNGKGIPENFQSKIFVPNFTTKTSGTGLGLAFVKQAIENAGGFVSFKSNIKDGTTFYIKIPLVKYETTIKIV